MFQTDTLRRVTKYTAGDDQQSMTSQDNSGSFPASAMYDTIKWKREGYD